jgi:hypothetical protein
MLFCERTLCINRSFGKPNCRYEYNIVTGLKSRVGAQRFNVPQGKQQMTGLCKLSNALRVLYSTEGFLSKLGTVSFSTGTLFRGVVYYVS